MSRIATWNRYSYSLANPLLYFDPDGRKATIAQAWQSCQSAGLCTPRWMHRDVSAQVATIYDRPSIRSAVESRFSPGATTLSSYAVPDAGDGAEGDLVFALAILAHASGMEPDRDAALDYGTVRAVRALDQVQYKGIRPNVDTVATAILVMKNDDPQEKAMKALVGKLGVTNVEFRRTDKGPVLTLTASQKNGEVVIIRYTLEEDKSDDGEEQKDFTTGIDHRTSGSPAITLAVDEQNSTTGHGGWNPP